MGDRRQSVSACVITYNRSAIVGTCLRGVAFADEVILVDKTSTDDTRAVAARYVDRIVTVPWSPTVEETRSLAVSLCRHDWILLLDDDECLNPAAVGFIRRELAAPRADIYAFPLRHYILGRHDERAYYWPEHHVRLFRRGAVEFGTTVHAGLTARSDRVMRIDADSGACIHHLSHPDVAGWIERTNRYTSRQDRARIDAPAERKRPVPMTPAGVAQNGRSGEDPTSGDAAAKSRPPEGASMELARFAHDRIDHWLSRTQDPDGDDYLQAVAVLRAVYDIVDRLKTWEEARGVEGAALFRDACARLDAAHAAAGTGRTVATGPAAWIRRLLHRRAAGPRTDFAIMPLFGLRPPG